MSLVAESYKDLQSDIIALLSGSDELAAWDADWGAVQKVFEGIRDGLRGARNIGRMPFVEVGYPVERHEKSSTADYGGRLELRLRCRMVRGWNGADTGEESGEMFHRIWQTLAPAMESGTSNCPGLRNGRISIVDEPHFSPDGRALYFDVRVSWDAPLPG